jgi:hypothetical protein
MAFGSSILLVDLPALQLLGEKEAKETGFTVINNYSVRLMEGVAKANKKQMKSNL